MRRYLTANSIEQVMDEFEGYYNKHYDGISASERFGYTDDREKKRAANDRELWHRKKCGI
ncbi:hypothetical protein QW180_15450 [Vibrio sinaloensis]|nr:hypothetical protein [Vibrio sinaloensis]